jgi:hypothetical protein
MLDLEEVGDRCAKLLCAFLISFLCIDPRRMCYLRLEAIMVAFASGTD